MQNCILYIYIMLLLTFNYSLENSNSVTLCEQLNSYFRRRNFVICAMVILPWRGTRIRSLPSARSRIWRSETSRPAANPHSHGERESFSNCVFNLINKGRDKWLASRCTQCPSFVNVSSRVSHKGACVCGGGRRCRRRRCELNPITHSQDGEERKTNYSESERPSAWMCVCGIRCTHMAHSLPMAHRQLVFSP